MGVLDVRGMCWEEGRMGMSHAFMFENLENALGNIQSLYFNTNPFAP